MTPILKAKHDTAISRNFTYSLVGISGSSAGLILGLLASLSWPECLMLMFTLGALAGGAVFTFFEMRALN